MEVADVMIYILVVFLTVVLISISSMGIEIYNKNEDYKKKKKTNYNYLMFNMIAGALILAFVIIAVPSFKIGQNYPEISKLKNTIKGLSLV